jgi:putative membrane protein
MFAFNWEQIIDMTEAVETIVYWVVLFGFAGLLMLIFEIITPYKDREELENGNIAVAAQFAGKLIGIGLITEASIAENVNVWGALIWVGIGYILMIISYYLFELVTPFKVEKEIAKSNVAVGIVTASVSVFIGLLVAGAIS